MPFEGGLLSFPMVRDQTGLRPSSSSRRTTPSTCRCAPWPSSTLWDTGSESFWEASLAGPKGAVSSCRCSGGRSDLQAEFLWRLCYEVQKLCRQKPGFSCRTFNHTEWKHPAASESSTFGVSWVRKMSACFPVPLPHEAVSFLCTGWLVWRQFPRGVVVTL